MKKLLTMKQFSGLSGIETSTLRYWDNIGLFAPAVRNSENNYRYYEPIQIMTAHFISVLSNLGVPLKTIKEMETERSPEKAARLISQKAKELDDEMRRLRDNYAIIHTRLELINYGMRVQEGLETVDVDKIAVLYRDKSSYIMGPRNKFVEGEDFYEPFNIFCRQAEELRINLGFPIVGYHDDTDAFLKNPGQPNAFISMDPGGNRTRKAGKYLAGFCRNYYGRFGDLPERMTAYVKEHKLKTSGPVFTTYLQDELCVKDPDQYLVEVTVRIKD